MSPGNPALEQFIRSIPLFSLVEPANMGEVLRLLRPVDLKPGEVLFREGEPGRAMWVLSERAEVSVSSASEAQRRPVVVAYARGGDVLGEMALVDDGPRSGTAVVVQGGLAYQIDAQEFHAMRSTFAPAAYQVLRQVCVDLCKRLRQTNDRIVPPGEAEAGTPPVPDGPRPVVEMLERFGPFKALPSVVKLALGQKLQVIVLDQPTRLFAEGEKSDGAWFVLEGDVTVGRGGKTLATLPAGSMFGVVACIDNGPRSASCATTGPAVLFRMNERDFDQLFQTGNRFAYQMVDLVARQLVQHVREANHLVPIVKPVAPAQAETFTLNDLDVENVLPLELEIDLGEMENQGELLG